MLCNSNCILMHPNMCCGQKCYLPSSVTAKSDDQGLIYPLWLQAVGENFSFIVPDVVHADDTL